MLNLRLRQEFRDKRLKGTVIDFTNRHGTGALDRPAAEFLNITYPAIDLLKTIEALGSGKSRPIVIIGQRGQGKSHLMAALSQMYKDPIAAQNWLKSWSTFLDREDIAELKLDTGRKIIAESMHLQKYKFLWDLLFDCHPHGIFIKGKWEGSGPAKTDIPSSDLLVEMFEKQSTVLILDEFQTWYEGLTNTKQYPWKQWAFNFIQILSEISEKNPEILSLVVSVRDGDSDSAQQIYRINPVRVDFKGPQANKDRQRLLLYRIFENRMQVAESDIRQLIQTHIEEYFRLYNIPVPEQEKHFDEFLHAWPFSPKLIQLLNDQVLIATGTQETRDLLRILVDIFKGSGDSSPVLTAADFSITNEESGVASLLDSVANQLHRDLRSKALRNLEAVKEATEGTLQKLDHLVEILSALWLRSLSLEKISGARPEELQLDITRSRKIDDNQFHAELAIIEENSFNIHRTGGRLVFLNEDNPQSKLLAHAKNDRFFVGGEDANYLAQEIRYVLGGQEEISSVGRIIVLKKDWEGSPWKDVEECDKPENWDGRIPHIVIPKGEIKSKDLGNWLKNNITRYRNTVRFILAKEGLETIFYDKPLLVTARAVYLAKEWKSKDLKYSGLHIKFQKELREQLQNRFDRFAILNVWNYTKPESCEFHLMSYKEQGNKILPKIQELIRRDLFIHEEFEAVVLAGAKNNSSIATIIDQLKEPMIGGMPSIPWLGEIEVKEYILRLCASGKIQINLSGRDLLSSRPGEQEDLAWNRMKGKLGTGRQLEQTTLHEPDSIVSSGGGKTIEIPKTISQEYPISTENSNQFEVKDPPNIFTGSPPSQTNRKKLTTPDTSSLNLLGKLENWGIVPGTKVENIRISIGKMSGIQLQELIRKLPDGIIYSLEIEKEDL